MKNGQWTLGQNKPKQSQFGGKLDECNYCLSRGL